MIHPARLWNEVPGFDNYYASIYGDILSLVNPEPAILKQSLDSKGYAVVNLKGAVRRVHRLVAAAHLGLDLSKPAQVIMHLDDNPLNNNVANLRIGTQADNVRDMHVKGRANPRKKITDEQVILIRKRLANGERGVHLAAEFGVSSSYMSFLRTGTRRTNL